MLTYATISETCGDNNSEMVSSLQIFEFINSSIFTNFYFPFEDDHTVNETRIEV